MELVRIVGGLAVIAVIVVAVGMDRQGDGTDQAAAPVVVERSFSSSSSSARFVSVAPKE